MKEGYVGLFRCLLEKPIWRNSSPEQKTVLITLLLMVNHHKAEWEWEGEKFTVMPGQTITSIEKIAAKAGKGISTQNVRTALTRFKKFEFLTDKVTKTGRLITILNWEVYQDTKIKPNKVTNKDLTNNQQTPNKQLTPNNKDNKDNKNKNDSNISEKSPFDNAVEEFSKMRKSIKSPLTERALELLMKNLDKLANTDEKKIQILEQSIMNSWKGVFPLKVNNTNQSYTKPNAFTDYKQRDTNYSDVEKQFQEKDKAESTGDWKEKLKETRKILGGKE